MTDEEFDAYVDLTIEIGEELTERAKRAVDLNGRIAALLEMERVVAFDLTEAQRIKLLAVAIVNIALFEMESGF